MSDEQFILSIARENIAVLAKGMFLECHIFKDAFAMELGKPYKIALSPEVRAARPACEVAG